MRQKDFFRYQQFTIDQRHAAMKVGTDSDLLGALAGVPEPDETDATEGNTAPDRMLRILDIGTGTGVLSLMMAQRCPTAQITAIEIDDNAVIDARANFQASRFAHCITLVHSSLQDYMAEMERRASAAPATEADAGTLASFDAVLCNPPYFDRSLECDDLGRTRARHTSSLPFEVLIDAAYRLLREGGLFSVCIPPEVLSDFKTQCLLRGFWLQDDYQVQSIPGKPAKRYVLVHRRGRMITPRQHYCCMRNADRTRSDWYNQLMREFHTVEL